MKHPYSDAKDYQLHRRAFRSDGRLSFNPVVAPKFAFGDSENITTMGSCFAQEVSHWLVRKRRNFLRVVQPNSVGKNVIINDSGRPLFSGEYGNVYTARQALQLVSAAIGAQQFSDDAWQDSEGFYCDPLRPSVASGFRSIDEMLASRASLLDDVGALLQRTDVFLLTLGLTEYWVRNKDGAALPSAPGVIGGCYVPTDYSFVNASFQSVVDDLLVIHGILKSINSEMKIVITVSPIPLAATAENRHIAVSSMASKATLRSAADALWRRTDIDYFPSFEMFYTAGVCDSVFTEDYRHASKFGVERVMSAFEVSYFQARDTSVAVRPNCYASREQARSFVDSVNAVSGRVICDEDRI